MPQRKPAQIIELPPGTVSDWQHHAMRSMVSQINHQVRNSVGVAQNAVGRIDILLDEIKTNPSTDRIAEIHEKIRDLSAKASLALTRTLTESTPLRNGVQGPQLESPPQPFSISQVLVSLCRNIDPDGHIDIECKAFPDYVSTHAGQLDLVFAPLLLNAGYRIQAGRHEKVKVEITNSTPDASICVDIIEPDTAGTATHLKELVAIDGVTQGWRGLASCVATLYAMGATLNLSDKLPPGVTSRIMFPAARKS